MLTITILRLFGFCLGCVGECCVLLVLMVRLFIDNRYCGEITRSAVDELEKVYSIISMIKSTTNEDINLYACYEFDETKNGNMLNAFFYHGKVLPLECFNRKYSGIRELYAYQKTVLKVRRSIND